MNFDLLRSPPKKITISGLDDRSGEANLPILIFVGYEVKIRQKEIKTMAREGALACVGAGMVALKDQYFMALKKNKNKHDSRKCLLPRAERQVLSLAISCYA